MLKTTRKFWRALHLPTFRSSFSASVGSKKPPLIIMRSAQVMPEPSEGSAPAAQSIAMAIEAYHSSSRRGWRLRWVIDPRKAEFVAYWDLVAAIALLYVALVTPVEENTPRGVGAEIQQSRPAANPAADWASTRAQEHRHRHPQSLP